MELEFIPERVTIIKRLKGISIIDIDNRMKELSGAKNSFNIDRWEKIPAKRSFDKIQLLAKAVEVPIGFFFYKNVEINMNNLEVEIYIFDTKESVKFNFLTNYQKQK